MREYVVWLYDVIAKVTFALSEGNLREYGYWLYSAMTQATAALFGIIGMFFIFKLTSLRERIKDGEQNVINALKNIGLGERGLERMRFAEVKKILEDEIKFREEIDKAPSEVVEQRGVKSKIQNRQELDLLRDRRDTLKTAGEDYSNSAQDSIDAIKILAIIFGFSLTLLILNPLLAKVPWIFILLTLLYILSLAIAFTKTWRIMGNLLKR